MVRFVTARDGTHKLVAIFDDGKNWNLQPGPFDGGVSGSGSGIAWNGVMWLTGGGSAPNEYPAAPGIITNMYKLR